jgi:xylan 1,4-beta-xylosidase
MPEEIDALAAAGRAGVSVLVWRHADDQYATATRAAEVELRLERLSLGARVRVSHWRIDARHSNSHSAWRALGAPQDVSASQLRAITTRQGLERYAPDRTATVRNGALTLRLALPLPSVSLIEIRPASRTARRAPSDRSKRGRRR